MFIICNGGLQIHNICCNFPQDYKSGGAGQVKETITGSLTIVSENPYCTSCQGVIQQFSNMFPNIEITLIDGVR